MKKWFKKIIKIVIGAIIGIVVIFLGAIIVLESTKSDIWGIWENVDEHVYYTFFDDNYVNIRAIDEKGNCTILEVPYKGTDDKIFIHFLNDSIIWNIQNIDEQQMNIVDMSNEILTLQKRGNDVMDYTPFPIGENKKLIFGTWYINEYKERFTVFRNRICSISNEKELFSLDFDFPETSEMILKIKDINGNIKYTFDFQDIKEDTCKVNVIKNGQTEKVILTKMLDVGIWSK